MTAVSVQQQERSAYVPLSGVSLAQRLYPAMPAGGWRGWIGPLVVVVIAVALRLPNLGRPREFVFDETYYAKDALSLLRFGNEQRMAESANDLILNSDGNPWTVMPFVDGPAYVVHPPLGKWIIAAGEALFGMNPTGWRVGVLVCGLISVLLLARIARRLLRSNLWGTVAGLLLAIDGLAIVMSRTAVLDGILMMFVLMAFGALLLDRDQLRRSLADQVQKAGGSLAAWGSNGPPISLLRPWRLAAAVALGAACSVKWSGIWFVAAFGLLTVLWDLGLRRTLHAKRPFFATLVQDAIPTAVAWVAAVVVVYMTSWAGWFFTSTGYFRAWAETNSSAVPGALGSSLHYHSEALKFHTGLSSSHNYEASAWGWPVLARPTSFSYTSTVDCGAPDCAAAVTALGNPLIWWAAALALIHMLWRWGARRDWRAGAVLCGFVAGWVPWLFFPERTIFFFYSIVFLPFSILALTLSLSIIRGTTATVGGAESQQRRLLRAQIGIMVVAAFLVLAIITTWFFYPIWVGEPIPYSQWSLRMWLPTWV